MKTLASYNTSKEIAELYINSGLKDTKDVSALINESTKLFVQKVGRDEAIKICTPFMQNKESLYTIEGLYSFLEAIQIDDISFIDPFTGKIEHIAYIHLKK